MSRVTRSARSKPKTDRPQAGASAVKTGCLKQQVAPATSNRSFQPQRRLAVKGGAAGAQARTLDGESVRRLSELDSTLTSNTVARAGSYAAE
jgi:hypothetical protein